ncbi:MAG: rRNA cytosine-C5-methyltransferase [Bacteroidaceae bacterium]
MSILPEAFLQEMHRLFGSQEAEELAQAIVSGEQPVSIRVNPFKLPLVASAERVPWSSNGFYLKERLTFTFDPLFHAGCYYVQEASSMFVEQALRQYVTQPVVMLDLCAAPGGKSTLVREVLPEGSLLVANEVMRNRAQILTENIQKWGHPDTLVTSNRPADFAGLTNFFDVILTDVPCSGEGMFRKDETAITEWSVQNVELCARRQREILTDIWPSLRPGGLLIYSTCTYNASEDEENVDWIARELGAEVLPLAVASEWGIKGHYHFMPHRARGEGFFLAVLRKEGAEEWQALEERTLVKKAKKEKNKSKGKAKETATVAPEQLGRWLKSTAPNGESYNWQLIAEGDSYCALRTLHCPALAALREVGLYLLSIGVPLAMQKGKDLIPNQALALSCALQKEVFPQVELSYNQAISYLRRESVTLPDSTPKGYVVVTYKGQNLGFVKQISPRCNNLYPQEWRIRSGYLPEEVRTLLT